jgi:monooxygenase
MTPEHFDVVIVGAGISGIGAGVHLKKNCPTRTYVILEGRQNIGGTWDLFRYPGIRSDSDMYTLGYAFKPWKDQKAIADGPSILDYLSETADEYGIADHIRFHHHVKSANWCSKTHQWTVVARVGEDEGSKSFTCNFLFMCSGYYNYDQGYTPAFEGLEDFKGQIIHPQFWPERLKYSGKHVTVIGSGATAVTIVPEIAKEAAEVVMLQRSPTYMASSPSEDKAANWLKKKLPGLASYRIIRWRNVLMGMIFFNWSRKRPEQIKKYLIKRVKKELGPDFDVEKHFTPRYNPWDQRICLVTNGDLFSSIKSGKTKVVTDQIESFTLEGLKLKSGETIKSDIIVTATGLDLQLLSNLQISIDNKAKDASQTMAYKGMMYSDIPNLASSFGYTNASWTLKCDLTCEYVCRLLNHMEKNHYSQCTPRLNNPDVKEAPWLDFTSSYVRRSIDRFPKQGTKAPWKLHQNYFYDLLSLSHSKLEDGAMEFK